MAAIQIKGVPGDLHEAARTRATQQGMSLSAYVLSLLEHDLARPRWDDWIASMEGDEPVQGVDAAELIREAREERDQELARARRD